MNHSRAIELARRQWSGNTKSVIRGIGIVTCIYVNPELGKFWLIDYRLFAPDEDGKTKLDHAREMFDLVIHQKQLEFRCVLMDTWYASRQFMLHIERNGKIYYGPVQDNRQVDEGDLGGAHLPAGRCARMERRRKSARQEHPHQRPLPKGIVCNCSGSWSPQTARIMSLRTTPLNTRPMAHERCVPFVGRPAQLHREAKQVTGLEGCQCRKGRIQCNHIACAMLVWCRFKELAYETGRTVYQIKFGQLSDYLIEQLKSPSVKMALA